MKLLDLFCGVGGTSEGYRRAGFEVTGVDIVYQPRYPMPFIQADAIEYLLSHGAEYDIIAASPPCQAYSWSTKRIDYKEYVDLLSPTREALLSTGKPYIVENVVGAPLINPIRLCGEMFGLGVIRHRLFETNFPLEQPPHKKHRGKVTDGTYMTVAGHGGNSKYYSIEKIKIAMGIDWTNNKVELTQSIPPAYTEWIGNKILEGCRSPA